MVRFTEYCLFVSNIDTLDYNESCLLILKNPILFLWQDVIFIVL